MRSRFSQTWLPVVALIGAAGIFVHLQHHSGVTKFLSNLSPQALLKPELSLSTELDQKPVLPFQRKRLDRQPQAPSKPEPASMVATAPQSVQPEEWQAVTGLSEGVFRFQEDLLEIRIPRSRMQSLNLENSYLNVGRLAGPSRSILEIGLGLQGAVSPGEEYHPRMQAQIEFQDHKEELRIRVTLHKMDSNEVRVALVSEE